MPGMSSRLYLAAHSGDVATLEEIARQYPILLDGGSRFPFDKRLPEPPLHVAAFCGHLAFVEKILEIDPELAQQLDRRGLSPLHMAVAEDHLDVIRRLLRLDPDLCFLCDYNGRNPLHFAAMNGRVNALRVLIGGIEDRRRDDGVFLNAKDNHGFTLLHFAVRNQELETVEYLVTQTTRGIDLNALNSQGLTPVDMLTQFSLIRKNNIGQRMAKLLRGHGGTSSTAFNKTAAPEIWARKKEALMIVASLIATMAFQAAVNPPGGVWQEDSKSDPLQIAGKSIMAAKKPSLYTFFITSASFAFLLSLLELVLHMSNTISNSGVSFEMLLAYVKYISTLSLVVAYSIAVVFLTIMSGREVLMLVILVSVTTIWILLFLVFALIDGYRSRASALKTLIQFPPPR